MCYFKVLGFNKVPFTTSSDPEFLYLSKEHAAALDSALIELRLKRGLSVILGDLEIGKTALSRKLIQFLELFFRCLKEAGKAPLNFHFFLKKEE